MALIDKDQVKTELERSKVSFTDFEDDFTRGAMLCRNATICALLNFLDTLPEQPVESLEKEIEDYIEGCLGGLEGQEIASCARHFYELGQQSRPKVSDNSLEEEIEKYFQGWINDDEYGDALMPDYTGVNVEKCKDIARHFAEWGAEHLKR